MPDTTEINSGHVRCGTCKFYDENKDEKKLFDGWCLAGLKFNGKMVCTRAGVDKSGGSSCRDWVHKKTGLTHFEVMTKTPESTRTAEDVEYLSRFITWKGGT
jgi:hypothetical protein